MMLKLIDPGSETFFARLGEKVRQAPNFFRNAPVILELDGLPESLVFDFGDFKALLRECSLIPVGVQGGSRLHQEAALRAGLPQVPAGRPTREAARPETVDRSAQAASATSAPGAPAAPALAVSAATLEPLPPRSTLVINEVVRSGRQIYAPGGDLVVTAMVSAGAELLADGHIHVYGPLRGRALAGLSGDTGARIFCLSLEAEMVSIAGLYRVNEDIAPSIFRKSVQIYLKDKYLCLEPF